MLAKIYGERKSLSYVANRLIEFQANSLEDLWSGIYHRQVADWLKYMD